MHLCSRYILKSPDTKGGLLPERTKPAVHTQQIVYRDSVWLLPLPYLTRECKRESAVFINQLVKGWSRLLNHCGNNAVSLPRKYSPAQLSRVGSRKGQVFRWHEVPQSGYSRVAQISVQLFQWTCCTCDRTMRSCQRILINVLLFLDGILPRKKR